MSWHHESMEWIAVQHDQLPPPVFDHHHSSGYVPEYPQHIGHEGYMQPPVELQTYGTHFLHDTDAIQFRPRGSPIPSAFMEYHSHLAPSYHPGVSYSSTATTASRASNSPRLSEERVFIGASSGFVASPTFSPVSSPDCHGVSMREVQGISDAITEETMVLNQLTGIPTLTDHVDIHETGLPTPSETVVSAADTEQNTHYEEDSDSPDNSGDYNPAPRGKAPRRKSRSTTSKSGNLKKGSHKHKVSKTSTKSSSSAVSPKKTLSATQCPQCGLEQSNRAARDRHIQSAHTRPFSCIFERYGCTATFGAKNEWKRHCSTQHLRLCFYRCDVGTCVPQNPQKHQHLPGWELPIASQNGWNDFNRKDLFIQHHRRMHAPENYNEASQTEKDNFKAHCERVAQRCRVSARAPPPRTICGLCQAKGCPVVFEGVRAWETRMEHVGRHLENAKGEPTEWAEDTDLKQWLISEDLIQQDAKGEWKLSDHLKGEENRSSRR